MSDLEKLHDSLEPIPATSLEARSGGLAEPQWRRQETDLYIDLDGVHLGALKGANGWNAGYRDSYETPVPEAGIEVGVEQSSAGYTGVYALGLEGYKVEALNPDASSRKTMWRGGERAQVSYDHGNMAGSNMQDWVTANFGNPGTRFGVVRVTGPEGEVKHYALGADFKGEPDNWRVKGRLVEVRPSEQLSLTAHKHELESGITDQDSSDPSLIKGNTADGIRIDGGTVQDLETAFRHATPDVWILHAYERSAKAAGEFASLTMELLAEVAKSNPGLMDGTEELVDELGRRARLIDRKTRSDREGYLNSLDDDEAARIVYLNAIRQLANSRVSNSDKAHNYTFLTEKAFEVLKMSFSEGGAISIDRDSPLALKVTETIEADQRETTAAQHKRAEVLRGTVFGSESARSGAVYHAAIPGQKVEIDLADVKPLLTKEQTYLAFFYDNQTDTNSARTEGYLQSTIALIDIDGIKYALIDTRKPNGFMGNGRSTKTGNVYSKGERESGQFKLLQLLKGPEDPRCGQKVLEADYSFGGEYDRDIQPIYDFTTTIEGGRFKEAAKTGVTIEFDSYTNQLVIQAPDKKVGIMAIKEQARVLPKQPQDTESIEKRLEVKKWEKAVREVLKDTAKLREQLERRLEDSINIGRMTQDDIERGRAEIDKVVARGPARSYTYNGFRGDKWHRSQAYYVTVDNDGNIWGDFEPGRSEIGITGQPVSPGRHIVRRNPAN